MCLCHFLFSPFSQNTIAAKGKQSKEGIRNGFDDRRSKRPALMMHNHSLCASIDERTLLKSTNSTGLRRGAALCAVVLTTSVCVWRIMDQGGTLRPVALIRSPPGASVPRDLFLLPHAPDGLSISLSLSRFFSLVFVLFRCVRGELWNGAAREMMTVCLGHL